MAAAIICECCGKAIKTKDARHVRVYRMNSATSYNSGDCEDYFDICKECYTSIEELLKHKEKDK